MSAVSSLVRLADANNTVDDVQAALRVLGERTGDPVILGLDSGELSVSAARRKIPADFP